MTEIVQITKEKHQALHKIKGAKCNHSKYSLDGVAYIVAMFTRVNSVCYEALV